MVDKLTDQAKNMLDCMEKAKRKENCNENK